MFFIALESLKDKVISFEDSNAIKNELLIREIPVEMHLFEKEGHGFKDGKIKVQVLRDTESFFRKYLNI